MDNRLPQFGQKVDEKADTLLEKMAQDIFVLSKAKVPKKDGALGSSAVSEKIKAKSHRVSYNEPYAGYQERGRRKDGSRVVKNYTTAGTNKNFLKDAGTKIVSKANEYAKQVMGRATT